MKQNFEDQWSFKFGYEAENCLWNMECKNVSPILYMCINVCMCVHMCVRVHMCVCVRLCRTTRRSLESIVVLDSTGTKEDKHLWTPAGCSVDTVSWWEWSHVWGVVK